MNRFFPEVRASELQRFQFFFTLAALLLSSQAMAMAVCESLLLSRLGLAALPYSILLASGLTIVCSSLYSRWVGKWRHEKFLLLLCVVAAAIVLLSIPLVFAKLKAAYVGVFCFHYVTYTLFTGHLQTLSTDYFDTLAAKRLMPLVLVGATLGEIVGGLSSSFIMGFLPIECLLLGWAGLLLLAALYTYLNGQKLRDWNPEAASKQNRSGASRVAPRLGTRLWKSPFYFSLIGFTCSSALALAMSQYVVADIFVVTFPKEEGLASFLGLFTAFSNALELFLASRVTPKVLKQLGVARANAIHAVGTLTTLALLAWSYSFWPAILAWMNRKTLRDALAGTVKKLVFNAVPIAERAAVMSYVDGVAGSAARACASVMLFTMQDSVPPKTFVYWGLAFSVLFFVSAIWVGRNYFRSLLEDIALGRFSAASSGQELTNETVGLLWVKATKTGKVEELQNLARELLSRGQTSMLTRGLEHSFPQVRQVCAEALVSAKPEAYLTAASPELRLAATKSLWREPNLLQAMLDDNDPRVARTAGLACGTVTEIKKPQDLACLHSKHIEIVRTLLHSERESFQMAALQRLAQERDFPIEIFLEKVGQAPHVADTALRCLAQSQDPLVTSRLAEFLEHPIARLRRLAATLLSGRQAEILPFVRPYMRAEKRFVVEAAYEALQGREGPSGLALAWELRLLVQEAWKDQIVSGRLGCAKEFRTLCVALEDRAQRCQQLALKVLALLEGQKVVGSVVSSLRFSRSSKRASALEVLSNLGDRESASLLILLLEQSPLEERLELAQKASPALSGLPIEASSLLELCLQSPGKYVVLAARAALAEKRDPLLEKLHHLKQSKLFSELSLDELELVLNNLVEEHFPPETEIAVRGQLNNKLYLPIEGALEPDLPFFGELEALDGKPALTTVVSTKPCRLWSLEASKLKGLMLQQPSLCFPLLTSLTQRVKQVETL